MPDNSVVIAVSQSGETADTIEAIRYAREKHGAKICSIVNVVGSSLTRYSDEVIITTAGLEIAVASQKAYCTQVSALTMIALRIAEIKKTYSLEDIKKYRDALLQTVNVTEKILIEEGKIKEIGEKISDETICKIFHPILFEQLPLNI
ncbi:Glutamine--fructose-6-phosphate aminotransferase [isomerizing] [subsurface metagenome]